MKISSGYENRKARLEMLPLIDVIFLLLVFFISAMLSMTVHKGIKVELPAVSTAETEPRKSVVVTITGDNRLYVNKNETNLNGFIREIESLSGFGDLSVVVNGDRSADLGIGVSVLDRLRETGIKEVSFECVSKEP